MSADASPPTFAGDLFLTLAADGRLVVDAARADAGIAELERTLAVVRRRVRMLAIWQSASDHRLADLPAEVARDVVDAVFAEQMAPGRQRAAAEELPKYIEALRRARRPPEDEPEVS